MGRQKKSPATPAAESTQPQPGKSGRARRMLKWLPLLLILSIAPAARDQLPKLSDRPEYQLDLSKLTLDPAPSGAVPADLLERVFEQAEADDKLSILNATTVKQLAELVGQSPWVRSIRRVEIGYPARGTISVEYRQPVAVIDVDGAWYPVDVDGIVLPPKDFTLAQAMAYPRVVGVKVRPRGQPGRQWANPVVLAGARIADVLRADWNDLGLDSIHPRPDQDDATPWQDLQFDLWTVGKSRIAWGRAPGSPHPGELSPDQKLTRLHKCYSEFGGFDSPHGPFEIDIRHWQEVTRRRLATTQENATRTVRPLR